MFPSRRLLSLLSNNNNNNNNKTSIRSPFSSSSSSSPSPTAPASDYYAAAANNYNNNSRGRRQPWLGSLLKFGFFSALTGATAGAAYATYAYTYEEVDLKTKGIREYNITTTDGASALEKFQALLYSTFMTVPAKSIELYLNLRRSIDDGAWEYMKLLPELSIEDKRNHVFTLVLDLNDTLVYSDFKPERGWKTFKRPGVDDFLSRLGQYYEIVVYTDQPSEYVEPILQRLIEKFSVSPVRYTLPKPATRYQNGQRYRDLSKLNRDLSRIIYVSGHALENSLQPENSVPVKAWKLEADDRSLLDLLPFLEYVGRHKPEDIRTTLATYKGHDIPSEFSRRAKEQKVGRLWRR